MYKLFIVPCPLANDPVACLAEKQRRHLPLRYRTHIECDYCQYAYENAVKAHVPEPGFGPYCIQCGGPLPLTKYGGKGQTISGTCRECGTRGKTNKGNRTNHHKAHWGYKAMASKIIKYQKDRRGAA